MTSKVKASTRSGVTQTKPVKWYETWTFLIFICLVVPLSLRSLFYAPFHIPSGSMKPTLLIGDFILVDKGIYGYSRYSFPFGLPFFSGRVSVDQMPRRGEVVVFRPPPQSGTDFIKRIIGLPGDRIQVKESRLYVNGEIVPRSRAEDFIEEPQNGPREVTGRFIETLTREDGSVVRYETLDTTASGHFDNTIEYVVPEGSYFMMGDNRDNSYDSRGEGVGIVPLENIVGRADKIIMSTSSHIWMFWDWFSSMRGDRFWINIQKE